MKGLILLALLLSISSAIQSVTSNSTAATSTPTTTPTTTPTPTTKPTPTTTPTPTITSTPTTKPTPTTTPTPTITSTPTTKPTPTTTPTPTITSTPTTKPTPTTTPTPTITSTPTTKPTPTTTPTPTITSTPTTKPTPTTTPTPTITSTPTTKPTPTTTLTPTTTSTPTTKPTSPISTSLVSMTSVSSTVSTTTVTTISAGSGNSDTATTSPTISVTNNGSSVNTTTQNNSSAATSSVTSSKTSTPTIPSPPGPSSPCQGAPCKGDSSCVSLNSTYFCLCFFGYYYNSSTCKKGKVFPGTIKVEVSEVSGLGDENSLAYQQLHNKVIEFFGGAFRISDYGQTVIDGVSIRPSARLEMRAGGTGVEVTVLNIFAETTKENEGTVLKLVTKAIENNTNNILGYSNQSLCDYFNCEKENAQDKCDNGLLCKCKPGFERPNPQIPMCLASAPTCPDTCNANNNRQCLVNKDNTGVECVCLSGYKEDDHGICQKCGFGYGGVNCEDQFQLILTIVGSIGGALILGLVIALICLTRSKNKDKYIEEQNLIENDFQNLRLQQTTGFSNLGADGSIFPKVRANISGQPQNPYANHRSMPRPDY